MNTDRKDPSPPLVVVIPTHGRPDLLERTLNSLARCSVPDSYEGAVVVENGSREGAESVGARLAGQHPAMRLRYMHIKSSNKSLALNAVIETLGDVLVLFLDDDVRVHEQLLVQYAEAARGISGGTFFGSSCGVDYESRPPEWLIPLLPYSARGMDLRSRDRPWEYLGCNWAAFASDLRAAGPFDPNRGPGTATGAVGQETEMQHRLAEAGATRVDLPDVLVWHYVPRERCSLEWLVRRRIREGVAHSVSRRSRGLGRASLLTTVLRETPRYVAAVPWRAIRGDPTGAVGAVLGWFVLCGRVQGALVRTTFEHRG